MTKDEALKMAIEALNQAAEWLAGDDKFDVYNIDKAYFACKEALEQPAQEPVDVARVQVDGSVEWRPDLPDLPVGTKLYTHPAPSQWISVKDRFPEFVDISDFEKSSSDILILIDGKHIYIGSYIWDSYSTEFCMRDLDGGYEGAGDMNVTHWMPLPEAPKE